MGQGPCVALVVVAMETEGVWWCARLPPSRLHPDGGASISSAPQPASVTASIEREGRQQRGSSVRSNWRVRSLCHGRRRGAAAAKSLTARGNVARRFYPTLYEALRRMEDSSVRSDSLEVWGHFTEPLLGGHAGGRADAGGWAGET